MKQEMNKNGLAVRHISTPATLTRLLSLVIRLHRQTTRIRTTRIERMERKINLADKSLDVPDSG
jgi:hypothetical protein